MEQPVTGQNPRIRINVNQLAKGQLRFDCTFEAEGVLSTELLEQAREQALAESDELVAALVARYPATEA